MTDPLIDIPQLVDLALGPPDLGVVNFNLLHSLLHIIVNHLNFDQCRVEFQGNQAIAIKNLLNTLPQAPSIEFIEYDCESSVDKQGKNLKIKKRQIKKKTESNSVNSIVVVKKTKDKDDGHKEMVTPVRKLPPGYPVQPINLVDHQDFERLSQRVDSLHDTLTTILPNNVDIINCDSSGLQEMWNLLNMAKRIDALEIGLQKFSSLVNDLTGQYRKNESLISQYKVTASELSDIKGRVDELSRILYEEGKLDTMAYIRTPATKDVSGLTKEGSTIGGVGGAGGSAGGGGSSGGGAGGGIRLSAGMNLTHDQRAAAIANIMAPEMEAIRKEVAAMQSGLTMLSSYLQQNQLLPEGTTEMFQALEEQAPGSATAIPKEPKDKKKSDRKHQLVDSKLSTLERQVDDFDKLVAQLDAKVTALSDSMTSQQQDGDFSEIEEKIIATQKSIDCVVEKLNELQQMTNDTKNLIELINERCDEIQLFKADKDEIEEVLTEKADNKMLQRKVSVDQFEVTKRDLNNSVQMMLNKMNGKEAEFSTIQDDFNAMLDKKLDKESLEPFRADVNGKLEALQAQLKSLATLRRDPEAAGTKIKYLRNVNCLSCDQDVIMKVNEDPLCIPRSEGLKPTRSLRPFLSFELSNIRKEISDIGQARNLHHYETIMQKHPDVGTIDLNRRHLCSRYCGGSHTAISREDRIKKTKNFTPGRPALDQQPEYLVRGIDGSMYRGDGQGKDCICPPMCPQINKDTPKDVEVKPTSPAKPKDKALEMTSYIN